MEPMGEANLVQPGVPNSQQPIAALLPALCARSPEAWRDLYDQYAPGIHWFAVTLLLGDTETAKDVVVETMADAARRIGRFDPRKSSLSTWLYGIARRCVQIEIRRQRRHKAVPAWAQVPLDAIAEQGDERDLAADASARLDAQRKVGLLARSLSEVEMELLTLSCIEELSTSEIGEVVGRSEQAVNSILYRARRKARERLSADDN
jgi:RNA polymerase sigma-70 factor (ECF subfamily)